MKYFDYTIPVGLPEFRQIRVPSPFRQDQDSIEQPIATHASKFNSNSEVFGFGLDVQKEDEIIYTYLIEFFFPERKMEVTISVDYEVLYDTIEYNMGSRETKLFNFLFNCTKMLISAKLTEKNGVQIKIFKEENLPNDSISMEPLKFNYYYYQINGYKGSIYSYNSLLSWFKNKCVDPNTNHSVYNIEKVLIRKA